MEINVIRSNREAVTVLTVSNSVTNESEYFSEYLATAQYGKYNPFNQSLYIFFNRARLEEVLVKYNFGAVAEVRISVSKIFDKLMCSDLIKDSMLEFNDFTYGKLVFEAMKTKKMLDDNVQCFPLFPTYGSPDFNNYVRMGELKRSLDEKESALNAWKPKSTEYYAVYSKFIEDDEVNCDCIIADIGKYFT